MDLGKILSFISPAYGLASGQGLGKILPYLSPGMMLGQGLLGKHHDDGGDQQAQMPIPGAAANPMQGQMPGGMFGGAQQGGMQPNPWLMMMNRGGYQ